jgi:hypothetical protein
MTAANEEIEALLHDADEEIDAALLRKPWEARYFEALAEARLRERALEPQRAVPEWIAAVSSGVSAAAATCSAYRAGRGKPEPPGARTGSDPAGRRRAQHQAQAPSLACSLQARQDSR